MEEEYKMLREEIMFNLNKLHWYISIVSTVATALLAYILQSPDNIVLLSLFLASLVIMEGRIYSVTESNLRISAYMEVFLEPHLENRNWETYNFLKIHKYNSRTINVKKGIPINFITGINSVCLLIGIIVFIFNLVIIWENTLLINIIFSALNLILVTFLAYMAYINRGGNQRRDDYIRHWNLVKDKFETKGKSSAKH